LIASADPMAFIPLLFSSPSPDPPNGFQEGRAAETREEGCGLLPACCMIAPSVAMTICSVSEREWTEIDLVLRENQPAIG